MNILVHGTILGYGGISHHTREFTKNLSKHHSVKIRNFNIVDLEDWEEYTGPHILKNAKNLDDIHHKLLYQQTLYDTNGELEDYPLTGYDESFSPDIHIIMAEVNHPYHYQEYSGSVIFYFLWETTHIIPVFLEKLREIDYIWVPSKWQREVLIDSGIDPDKISVVNLSLDPNVFFPVKKKNEKLTLLHIGTWGYRKSTYEVIKSFLDAVGENEDVEFRVAIHNKLHWQDGPVETFKKFDLPLNKNIVFLNTLSEEDYVKEIQNADLYVSCSRGEGWNLPLIQSMACGVPSIYSKSGGQLEFSSNNLGTGIESISKFPAKRVLCINGNDYGWESLPDYLPNYLYEPEYTQLTEEIKSFYNSFLEGKNYHHAEKALKGSKYIHENFNGEHVTNGINKVLENYKNKNKICLDLSECRALGDNIAATPTLRKMYKSYNQKITVISSFREIFGNNPYVEKIYNPDSINIEYMKKNYKYHNTFYNLGKKDQFGVETKHNTIDIRQYHAIKLGMMLGNDELEYDYVPDTYENIENLPLKYVLIHPVQTWPSRTWSAENWVILTSLLNKRGISVVSIGKDSSETGFFNVQKPIFNFEIENGLNLMNKTTISQAWHLINNSIAFVTMDSGLLHLAGTTDTEIIMLGSSIRSEFRLPYRKNSQSYKQHYIAGNCRLSCASDVKYGVKEWGSIQGVPPLIGCLENKTSFECHPGSIQVYDKVISILNKEEHFSPAKIEKIIPSEDLDLDKSERKNKTLGTEFKDINKNDRKVLIDFMPTPIGDLIAAVPYLDKFREEKGSDVYVSVTNPELLVLFEETYPLLKFLKRTDGIDYDEKIVLDYNFLKKENKSIQSIFAEELGFIDPPYIRPSISIPITERKIKSKYVSMGIHSTLQYKYWNHPLGKRVQPESPNWNELCGLIRKNGYTPVILEKNETFGVPPFRNGLPKKSNKKVGQSLLETLNYIYHSEFYIGLSSGMAWAAHALGKPVVMISNFTEDWNEFDLSTEDYKRITNKSVCHGCFNNCTDSDYLKSKGGGEWYSCPRHRDTERQFECHTSITPEMVFNEIKDWMIK